MKELALHILDIAMNSVSAQAKNIRVEIEEDTSADILKIKIVDDGTGIYPEFLKHITDPFSTSRTIRKIGLGIPLLKEAAEMANGHFDIQSQVGKGTTVIADFQRSHFDRMPLGDIAETIVQLMITNPLVHWTFSYQFDDQLFTCDDRELKTVLDVNQLSNARVISYLRNLISEGIDNLDIESRKERA